MRRGFGVQCPREAALNGTWSADQTAVWQALEAIHGAWLRGPIDGLDALHHERAVIVGDDFRRLAEGRAACVASYHAYVGHAETLYFRTYDPTIDVAGTTAVAFFRFEVGYRAAGEECHEDGFDLNVLVREDGRWRVLWRQTHSVPADRERRRIHGSTVER
jgi:hypothetical protein